jgi:hypothetical protein
MFASHFVFPKERWSRIGWARAPAAALLAGSIALAGTAQAIAGPACKPTLAFKQVRFSEMHLETMQRKWTALLSVDASRCATASGRFEIMFSRLKENAPEIDFVEQFTWKPDLVEVSVDFWADEAVEEYRLTGVSACPCRD